MIIAVTGFVHLYANYCALSLVASWLLAAPVADQPATAVQCCQMGCGSFDRRADMVALSAPAVADQGPLEKKQTLASTLN
jgi:hypothetical protein